MNDFRLQRRPDAIDGSVDHELHVDVCEIETKFPGDDPGNIEQVFDEAAPERPHRVRSPESRARASPDRDHLRQEARPAEHRVEGCSKLVRDRGEKFVLQRLISSARPRAAFSLASRADSCKRISRV